ncbi:hypothetical protein [Streptomyces sp. BE133]|nr:hypothetical protein [Streptomyces sp. BE133]MEE1806690.1 hypothetical protein [Streptomyces sp. BE133]
MSVIADGPSADTVVSCAPAAQRKILSGVPGVIGYPWLVPY